MAGRRQGGEAVASVAALRAGDRVTFHPAGVGGRLESGTRTLRVVLAEGSHVVCNGGGPHGTPVVVMPQQFVAGRRPAARP